jgi:hypothetical protein
LVMRNRERVGREASPSAAVSDTQSVKTTEAGGPRGYDAGKKINGRKRHALVDTDGRGLEVQVQPASVLERDGAPSVLTASQARFPFIKKVFATAPMRARRSQTPLPSWWRSSASCPIRWASRSCRGAGWSSASSPGSTATGVSPRTSRPRSLRPPRSSMPLASCY